MKKLTAPLILASGSPRRRELLAQLPWSFQVQSADIDETLEAGEKPGPAVLRLAEQKARAVVIEQDSPCWVLGADTIVVVEQQILGKPSDREDAVRMLELLSGKTHQVMTAVALCSSQQSASFVTQTDVTFRHLSEEDIGWYWDSTEPADKAGAYGIQGLGGRFVQRITGSYSNVVGLPLCETESLITRIATED